MKFLLFILLIAFSITSAPVLADECCLEEITHQAEQTQEKSKTCDAISCTSCVHHTHSAYIPTTNSRLAAIKIEEPTTLHIQAIIGDLKYPLIDPPSYS